MVEDDGTCLDFRFDEGVDGGGRLGRLVGQSFGYPIACGCKTRMIGDGADAGGCFIFGFL